MWDAVPKREEVHRRFRLNLEERALKSQVRLRPGTLALPTESETFTAELFEEVLLGPHREPASPLESGTFRVVRLPLPKETPAPNETAAAVYRFTYRQPFTLDDGRLLELEVVAPLEFRAQGEEPVSESQTLPGEFFVALKGREALQGRLDGEPLLYYGSCTYESLPLWDITAELEGGGTLRLEERFEAVESRFETAPAGLVRAEFELGGDQHVVREYFDLSYSAARHNTLLEYWVTLEPPVAIAGVGTVHTVELQAPEPERNRATATASYLGADFEILARPTVMRFVRRPRADLLFVRGDASGDGQLAVLDALVVLAGLFEGAALPCRQAADANDDGRVNIVDAIVVVSALFAAAGELPQPFPNCGADPTVDALPCDSPPACP